MVLKSRTNTIGEEHISLRLRVREENQISPAGGRLWILVGQFNDYAFGNLGETFEEVVLKEFRPDLFPPTPQGRLFEK
jgi:hypothetical protein